MKNQGIVTNAKQLWARIDRATEDLIDARDRVKNCLGCENF
jgi:hypothetical protein